MNHSRTLENKKNRINERSLRVVYNFKKASFKELLDKDKTVSIYINLGTLNQCIMELKPFSFWDQSYG